MIRALRTIPFYLLARRFGWPQMLPINVTVCPSTRCNSRCRTCNVWSRRENELTLEEWDRVFQSLARAPFWFTISGGEPFLFHDLVPLCQSLYHHCQPGIINIPTNGLLHEIIPGRVADICRSCPDAQIIINLSLDGVGQKHDNIRGVPGNFGKFEKTYHSLRELNCSNLTIGIHSVISRFNVHDVPELFDYALSLRPDSYITEIAEQRVELGTIGLDITPSPQDYSWAIEQLIERIESRQFRGVSKITEGFRVNYYRLVERILTQKAQLIPCFAGSASVQIFANGEVWPCCVRADNIGNLRDVDYEFKRIWFSPEADRIRLSIHNKECYCPLANAAYTNMLMHIPTLLRVGTNVAWESLPLNNSSVTPNPA